MMNNKMIRLLVIGVIVWLVPFVAWLGFFDRTGKPVANADLFKSIIVVISSFTAGYAIVSYFKRVHSYFTLEAIFAGFTWFAINIILDLLVLVPFSSIPYIDYFYSIGIRYLQIPVVCTTVGILLDRKLILKQ